MRFTGNSYGTNRDNKRRKGVCAIGIVMAALCNILACTPDLPAVEDKEPEIEGSISDWGNQETGTGSTDEGREMTREDSIRFGYIPKD